jgi:hypothetical protein
MEIRYIMMNNDELAVRMLEAAIGLSRPEGTSAVEALSALDFYAQTSMRAQAAAAMQYFHEQMAAAGFAVDLQRQRAAAGNA